MPGQQPKFIGQQPSHVRLPQQVGVKALYCLRQMVVVQQLLQLHGKQGHQAAAGCEPTATAARLRKPRAKSFFMGGESFSKPGRVPGSTLLVAGARPYS